MNEEISRFINACLEEYKYDQLGDSKNGNKQGKIVISISILLKKEDRLQELLDLLNHEHPQVRFRAAEKTLQISPSRAEKTLEELSTLRGMQLGGVAFVAQVTLQEWRKGNLKFPTEKTLKLIEQDIKQHESEEPDS